VFRRLGQIEQHLGSRLFERGRAASDVLLRHLLSAVFVAFRRVYPQIILDIVVSNQRLNLTKRDADVAVRAAYQAVFGAAAPGADRSCATASPQNLR